MAKVEAYTKGSIEDNEVEEKDSQLTDVIAIFLEHPHFSLNHSIAEELYYGKEIAIKFHYSLTQFNVVFYNQVKTLKKQKMFDTALTWAKQFGGWHVDGYWLSNKPSVGIYQLVVNIDPNQAKWALLAEHFGELFPLIAPYFKYPIKLPE